MRKLLALALAAFAVSGAGAPQRKVFKAAPPHPPSKTAQRAAPERHLEPRAAVLPPVEIAIDAKNVTHKIDPNIYGVAFANADRFGTSSDLDATINRWGGNAVSTHNWEINTTNRAKDYYFENIPDAVSQDVPGQAADDFITPTLANGMNALITIPLLDRLPKPPRPTFSPDTIPCSYDIAAHPSYVDQSCCADFDYSYRARCGNGVNSVTGDRLLTLNDPADTYDTFTSAHQANWISHMVAAHGNAASGTGVHFYALDNEPSLWSFDHWDMHPSGATSQEVWSKMAEYGAVIKAADPTSLTTGVEEWGWSGYFYSGADQEAARANGYTSYPEHDIYGDYVPWLLNQARAYEETNGTRILDYFTLHFYPQSGEFSNDDSDAMQLLRNQSTRDLWDPAYFDNSYIQDYVRLIPRMREWANNNYPGTKIGLTEYNWGDEGTDTNDPFDLGHINGATAQADILGILGREGIDMAVRWTAPPSTYQETLVYKAFRMYRNYDGGGSTFGDLSLHVTATDGAATDIADNIAVFGALRSTDGAMTVMIISKTPVSQGGVTRTVNLNLSNFAATGIVQRWQLDASNAITSPAPVSVGSPTVFTIDPQTITLLVIPGQYLAAPANVAASWNPASQCIVVTWTAVDGLAYEVFRNSGSGFNGDSPDATTPVSASSYSDCTFGAQPYLYKVRAMNATGMRSGFSNIDVATPWTAFTDDLAPSPGPPFPSPVVPIKAVYVNELRSLTDVLRQEAGIGGGAYTNVPVSGPTTLKAEHVRELRRAMNQARAWIGLPPVTYTDTALAAGTTLFDRRHINDLRNALK